MRTWLLLLAFILPVAQAGATTYYVSQAGSDSAAGTSEAAPWKTVAHTVAQKLQPGDTVLFRRGDTWREVLKAPVAGTAGAPITFGAWGTGNLPIFSGAALAAKWTAASGTSQWVTTEATTPNQVFFNGVLGTHVTSLAALTAANDWYWTGGSLYVYSPSSPATAFTAPGVEMSVENSSIDTNNLSWLVFDSLQGQYSNAGGGGGIVIGSTSSNIVISNCVFSWNYGNGIWIYQSAGGNLTIVGNDIHDNASGIYESSYTGGTASTPVLISNNTVHDNIGGDGIVIYGNYFTVDHNVLYNNGRSGNVDSIGIHIFTGDSASYATFGQNNVISNNIVSGQKSNQQDGSGIEVDHYTKNNTIHHNLVYGNYGPGIDIYDATNLNIFQNTSYGNSVNASGLSPKAEFSVATGGLGLVQNVSMMNNIGYATCPTCSAIYIDSKTSSAPGLVSQTNVWFSLTPNVFGGFMSGNSIAAWNAVPFVKRDMSADPAFSNAAANDYTLVPTSPARNMGTPITGFAFPYAAPDLGKWPYYAAGSNTNTF